MLTVVTVIFIFVMDIWVKSDGTKKTQSLIDTLLKQNDLLKKLSRIQQKRIAELENVVRLENEAVAMLMEKKKQEEQP
jgi:hypothetical protein